MRRWSSVGSSGKGEEGKRRTGDECSSQMGGWVRVGGGGGGGERGDKGVGRGGAAEWVGVGEW